MSVKRDIAKEVMPYVNDMYMDYEGLSMSTALSSLSRNEDEAKQGIITYLDRMESKLNKIREIL